MIRGIYFGDTLTPRKWGTVMNSGFPSAERACLAAVEMLIQENPRRVRSEGAMIQASGAEPAELAVYEVAGLPFVVPITCGDDTRVTTFDMLVAEQGFKPKASGETWRRWTRHRREAPLTTEPAYGLQGPFGSDRTLYGFQIGECDDRTWSMRKAEETELGVIGVRYDVSWRAFESGPVLSELALRYQNAMLNIEFVLRAAERYDVIYIGSFDGQLNINGYCPYTGAEFSLRYGQDGSIDNRSFAPPSVQAVRYVDYTTFLPTMALMMRPFFEDLPGPWKMLTGRL